VARKVVWTEPAADDLVETVEYIGRDSPSYAAALAQKVCDAGDSLAELSERGRPYPDPAHAGLRELILGPYRLVYEVQSERVVIHGVFHGSRDVPKLLRHRSSRRTRQ
jgi:toxin ParE1/3/4